MIGIYYLNPTNRKSVDIIAHHTGYHITPVEGDLDSVSQAGNNCGILLLAGDNSALNFSEIIRFKKRHPAIVLIIIDNRYQAHAAVAALRAKIWDYIILPAEIDHLTTSVRHLMTVLGNSRQRQRDIITSEDAFRQPRNVSNRTDAAVRYIEDHLDQPIRIDNLAKICSMSASTFTRNFRKEQGHSVIEFVQHLRIDKAKNLLIFTNKPIKQVAVEVGFNDVSYFTRIFKKNTMSNPRMFRDCHAK